MRKLAILIAAALLAAAFVSTIWESALAAGGGTLSVSSPVVLGQTFVISGCGYPAPTSISFEVNGPRKSGLDYFTAGEPLTDPAGCFSETWTAWWSVTGDYQITSMYRDTRGATHKAAVVKFTVTQ
jgi:hypothetical protein